jgi:next-to-BRCA1 protein 1
MVIIQAIPSNLSRRIPASGSLSLRFARQDVEDTTMPSVMGVIRYGGLIFRELYNSNSSQHIVGVRHKCLTCPDWDYCSSCIQSAKHIHPGHRFAPIYEPISDAPPKTQVHYGIYCDGPLCKSKGDRCYIVGDRYKCAVCHDTDFCANCEAVPVNRHNRTHPMIKFRTPVRNVSVTTLGEKGNGERMIQMGDRPPMTKSTATETTPATTSANAATQVHTVAEVKPFDEPVVEDAKENAQAATVTPVADLQAYFIRDSVPDSSQIVADTKFDQVWTLQNPGPLAWPAGCSVRFIGGDAMLNVDTTHPSSVSAIADATESNVIGREVQPGETLDFCVTLKAPDREGKAISYWRLKAANGTPFGHKLWCDIDVVKPCPVSPAKAEEVEKVEQEKVSETVEDVEELHESTMIFPKLDKESPMSSTHEASAAPTITDNTSTAEQELLEDVESLELEEEETDDGFLTDEEYDILDASDEEYLAEVQQPGKK